VEEFSSEAGSHQRKSSTENVIHFAVPLRIVLMKTLDWPGASGGDDNEMVQAKTFGNYDYESGKENSTLLESGNRGGSFDCVYSLIEAVLDGAGFAVRPATAGGMEA
jgi:hypothetical protein